MGCLGIIYCLEGRTKEIPFFVLIALIADFADGLVARSLNVKSELGKQLDSLADMVTFGVLPGMILYFLIYESINRTFVLPPNVLLKPEHAALIIPLFSALRLGKFNIDTRQTDSFLGLPTPAVGIFVIGLLLIFQYPGNGQFSFIISNSYVLIAIAIALSILMVVELPMLSLKFKNLSWKGNEWRYVLLAGAATLILVLKIHSPAFIILYYILLSINNAVFSKKEALLDSHY